MAVAKRKPQTAPNDEVDAFLAALDHPHKRDIEAVRKIVLGCDPSIADGIKWNAPSFRTTEWFATTHLRAKVGIGVILHLGAKARDLPPGGMAIDDPTALLQWLGKDRAMVTFRDAKDLAAKRSAFEAVVRQWIEFVEK